MNRIRQEKIQEYIESKGVATIKEIQKIVPDVSLMTIHRDLDVLENKGIIEKYRGGVRSVRQSGDIEFNVRMRENNNGKLTIAHKALELVQPYSSIFLDASTSNVFLARNLPDINLNIITTSPGIAIELCKLHNPVVTVCCGTMNRKNLSITGQNTLNMLGTVNIDTAFIGVSGCSADVGFTCGTEADMLIKRMVIGKSRAAVMMCGEEKLNRLMPYTFAGMEDVDYIVSDKQLPEDFLKSARSAGVKIL